MWKRTTALETITANRNACNIFLTHYQVMKISLFFIVNIFCSIISLAQHVSATDTTKVFYKNLPTLKVYAISSSSMTSADTSWFKIEDKEVDEKTYRKFTRYKDYINKCKPCILLSYDTSENLVYKHIAYGDCRVGYWIEYYTSGKVKVIGHYKENITGNWENIFARGYCREDGVWTYFDKKGQIRYSEIWKEGKLLKRVKRKVK